MKFNIKEEREFLAHIDEATRAEIIKRFAWYDREIRDRECEIEHLKEQFNQIMNSNRHLPTNYVDKIVRKGSKSVVAALKRAESCTVYYCKTVNRFSIITTEARLARLNRNAECVGTYTREGFSVNDMIEDLYTVFEE